MNRKLNQALRPFKYFPVYFLGIISVVILNLIGITAVTEAFNHQSAMSHQGEHRTTSATFCQQQCSSNSVVAIATTKKVIDQRRIYKSNDELPYYVSLLNYEPYEKMKVSYLPDVRQIRPPDILSLFSIFRF